MDRAGEREEVKKVIEKLEERLLRRIPSAYRRTPERLFRELFALNLVLELKTKLRHKA